MARSCPTCAVVMQPLFVEQDDGPDVELDRCAACGGVWFDAGEVEAVAQGRVRWESNGGASPRRCPDCREPLEPGRVKARWAAERCGRCLGLWLAAASVGSLGSAQLEALAARLVRHAEHPQSGPSMGFVCAKCSRRAPWTEANGTARGLVCRDCTPRSVDDPAHGPTILTKSDRLVDRMLVALDEEDAQLPRGSTTLGRPGPVFGFLLDWFLD